MDSDTIREIYFAGGCFWGTEHFFKQVRGVVSVESGYANGHTNKPIYEEVYTDTTGYAETVKVVYDRKIIRLKALIELFFKTIDPTSLNKQGKDVGTRYRTGIYYTNPKDKPTIDKAMEHIAKFYVNRIVVENKPLEVFYPAEEMHQDYLVKNPGGYCHIEPILFEFAKKTNPIKPKYKKQSKRFLKKKLTALQFAVTQRNETEPPFQNAYWNEFRPGIYVDITTGEPLFVSTDKFDAECGWPNFSKPIDESVIIKKVDKSHGMKRTEVRSKIGDAHLGHVFEDAPFGKGGLRYCINSAALRFIPKEDMKKEGYEVFLYLL